MSSDTQTRRTPIGLLKAVFTSQHLPKIFSGTETHEPICSFIAQLSRFTTDVSAIRDLVEAGLPHGYTGNSLDEIARMVDGAIARGFDKPTERVTKSASEPLLDVLLREVTLHHDQHGRGIIRIKFEKGGYRSLALASPEASSFVRRRLFQMSKRAMRTNELGDVLNTLQALAEFEGSLIEPVLRIGRVDENIYIDLGTDDGASVRITIDDWSVVFENQVHFLRSGGFRAWPMPRAGGDVFKLQRLLHLEDANFYRLLGFLVNALRDAGPYMLLLIEGEQGSGKSFVAWVIKSIIDPNGLMKQKLTDNDRDLMLHAQDHYLPVYDNVSGMRGDISDSLCTLATGGGFGTRKLYTNAEQQVFNYCRPFVINGIADFANRPDLLERAILIRLPALGSDVRREEKEMIADFREMLPEILGALYGAVSLALKNECVTVCPVPLRMADAARWICAAEPAFGLVDGAIVRAIADTQSEIMHERARNDVVVSALAKMVAEHPIEGTVGDLFGCLREIYGRYDKSFPATPAHLSRQLKRLKPAMAHMDMHVEFLGHRRAGTLVRVWRVGQEKQKPRDLTPPPENY